MKVRNKHDYMRETGKRISRGAWERLNRVYNVYLVKTTKVRTNRVDKFGNPIYVNVNSYTYVIHPESTKAHRKLGIRERYAPALTKRARYVPEKAVGVAKGVRSELQD